MKAKLYALTAAGITLSFLFAQFTFNKENAFENTTLLAFIYFVMFAHLFYQLGLTRAYSKSKVVYGNMRTEVKEIWKVTANTGDKIVNYWFGISYVIGIGIINFLALTMTKDLTMSLIPIISCILLSLAYTIVLALAPAAEVAFEKDFHLEAEQPYIP